MERDREREIENRIKHRRRRKNARKSGRRVNMDLRNFTAAILYSSPCARIIHAIYIGTRCKKHDVINISRIQIKIRFYI